MAHPAAAAALEQQLLQVGAALEQQVDAELDRLEKLDEDDMDTIRQRRIQQMKKAHQQRQEWKANGHGSYEEIADEKEFFKTSKNSKNVVCHFYRDATMRCKVVDRHLDILAQKHVETRFVKINAEKSPFLVERLRIVVLPTLCLIKDGKTIDYVVGFDDMGGKDDFPTEMLEWRIARADIIEYSGDIMTPPTGKEEVKKSAILAAKKTKKIIRDAHGDEDDDF